MGAFDDLARMKMQLLAERRGRMMQHPQQVAAGVNQGVDALWQAAEYLRQQDEAQAKAKALATENEAKRKAVRHG